MNIFQRLFPSFFSSTWQAPALPYQYNAEVEAHIIFGLFRDGIIDYFYSGEERYYSENHFVPVVIIGGPGWLHYIEKGCPEWDHMRKDEGDVPSTVRSAFRPEWRNKDVLMEVIKTFERLPELFFTQHVERVFKPNTPSKRIEYENFEIASKERASTFSS